MEALTQWHWLGLAAIFLIAEVLVSGGFLLWIGISAVVVGILVWIFPHEISWGMQMLLFGAGGVLSSVLWWLYLKHHPIKTDSPNLNLRNEQYVGRIFTLSEAIVNGRGKIRSGDSWWSVSGSDLPEGTKVKVIGVDGIILRVIKVENTE